jgi:hypothetical protein
MTADEARALDLARSGACFGELCAALAEDLGEGDAAAQAGQWLADWLRAGVVARVEG